MGQNWKTKVSLNVLDGLRQLFDKSTFTDILVDINGRTFHCHKLFLCAISDYFLAMFTSGMKESLDNKVKLMGVSESIFCDILCFYYEGKGSIVTVDNAEEMLRAATLLQMRCLQERCEDFYAEQISNENAMGIWRLAKSLHCENLLQRSTNFILKNFLAIAQEAEFVCLEVPELLDFLMDDELRVPNEDCILDSVVRWMSHDPSKRERFLVDVFKTIRLRYVSSQCLKLMVDSLGTVLSDDNSLEFLSRVLEEHSSPSSKKALDMSLPPRQYEEVLVAIGVHVSSRILPDVYAYNFSSLKWSPLCSLPIDPGIGFAVCAHDNKIYISGQSGRRAYLLCFDSSTNAWQDCPDMLDRRCYHAMVASGEGLYVVGGCNKREGALNTVDFYDVERHKWSSLGNLMIGVYSMSAAAIGDRIFVYGGRKRGGGRTREIQMFDLTIRMAAIVGQFPSPITESRAITVNDEAFVISTNGNILKVVEEGKVVDLGVIPNFDRYNFGLCCHQGSLVVIGGETRYPSGPGAFEDMIAVDTKTGRTSVLPDKLYPSASAVGCCKIILHQAALLNTFCSTGQDSSTYDSNT